MGYLWSYTQPYFRPAPARTRVPVQLRVRECVSEAAWTRQSQLHSHSGPSVSLSHTLCPPPLRLSPASCSHHRGAGADSPSSRHWEPAAGGRRSPLSGARMRCHKFWGPCSVGFYICAAMLFKGRFAEKSLLSFLVFFLLIHFLQWVHEAVRNGWFWLKNLLYSCRGLACVLDNLDLSLYRPLSVIPKWTNELWCGGIFHNKATCSFALETIKIKGKF